MRIAMISTCALATPPKKYGGTELVVAELTKGLLALGHDVTVFATGDSTTQGSLRHHFDRPVWPPNELAELRHASFAWQEIARAMRRFDVIHAHHAAALPQHVLVDRPMAMTIHHAHGPEMAEYYRSYPDVAYVAISQRHAQLSPEVPFARTIHHGLDPRLYAAGAGRGDYVAFLGRFAPEKAPHLAIDAARAAGVDIVLGGDCHEVPAAQHYFQQVLRPRIWMQADVRWRGELGHSEKTELLANARALLFPLNWEEPFGLVMIESMLVGTPVIAFARGSAPEVIEEGVTGYLVHDVAQMAQRIREIGRIDRVRCRQRAQERWSSLRMAREYADLYARITRRSSRPPAPRPAAGAVTLSLVSGHAQHGHKADNGAGLG